MVVGMRKAPGTLATIRSVSRGLSCVGISDSKEGDKTILPCAGSGGTQLRIIVPGPPLGIAYSGACCYSAAAVRPGAHRARLTAIDSSWVRQCSD